MDQAPAARSARRSRVLGTLFEEVPPATEKPSTFSSLFHGNQHGSPANQVKAESIVIPWYERLTEDAHPLCFLSPSVFVLKNPHSSRIYGHAVTTINLEIKIRVPEDIIAYVSPRPRLASRHQLRIHPVVITAADNRSVKLSITNCEGRPKDIPPGTELATVSFIRLALDTAIKELHPGGKEPLYTFAEKIFAGRRALHAAREEAALLGIPFSEPICWPSKNLPSTEEAPEPDYPSSSITSPSPFSDIVRQDNLPWNYSWGKSYSFL